MDGLKNLAMDATQVAHPFYPLGVEIVGYLANTSSTIALLGYFGLGLLVILAVTLGLVNRYNPKLSGWETAAISWFILCYFAFNHTRMAGSNGFFAQCWKEYAYADSRYLTSDPFVLCMETVTAVLWGPLSYVVVFCILSDNPLRYPLQALVSIGQIYGDILYYATSMFDHYHKGVTYCRPEAYYFWFYYFFMNFIWIVIPGILLYISFDRTAKAFTTVEKMSRAPKANGRANGHTKGE
ncbi:hypothetical protein MMC13_004087 [Lambiella insularis]|nr:hypothetical protein [Lambiella insularis]